MTGQVRSARTAVVDGVPVLVVERVPPIAPTLSLLLEGGRDTRGRVWRPMRIVTRGPLRLTGARAECLDQDHRMGPWVDGFAFDDRGLSRFLHLEACTDCGAVCVRDRSVDNLDGLPAGRRPLRRRDEILGWYSGARPKQRIYT